MSKNGSRWSQFWDETLDVVLATAWFILIMAAAVFIHWLVEQGEDHHLLTGLLATLFEVVAYVIAFLDAVRFVWYIVNKLFSDGP